MEEDDNNDEAAAAAPELAYYYTSSDGTKGPCTLAQLRVLWIMGDLRAGVPLWREGLDKWYPVEQLAEVYDVLSALKQPPVQADEGQKWHYLDASSKQCGGVTAVQMGVLLRRGDIDGLTKVWRSGMKQWTELGSVDELRAHLQQDEDEDDEEEERLAAMERLAQQVAYDPDAEQQQQAFAAGSGAGGGGAAAATDGSSASSTAAEASSSTASSNKPKRVRKKPTNKFVAKGGSNCYVSGLPSDTTVEEIAECFKVAGVIRTDPSTGGPRIKLYADAASGLLKGDALISFLKPESVNLAVTLREGYELRPGKPLTVQPAKFEKREGGDGGDGGEEAGVGGKRLGKDELAQRKKQRLLEQKALGEWEAGLSTAGKRNATVVLTNLFDATAIAAARAEPDNGAAFYANLKADITVECGKAGAVDKVFVFEESPLGAVSVKFKQHEHAERCAAMLDERTFGQATIRCALYDGVTDYRAPHKREGGGRGEASAGPAEEARMVVEEDDDEQSKLDSFGDWLEADSTDDEIDPNAAED